MGLSSWQSQSSTSSGAGQTAAIPFGTNPIQNAGYNLPISYATGTGNSAFFPPPGQYSFNFSMQGTLLSDETATIVGINGAVVTFFVNQSTSFISTNSGYLYIPATAAGVQPGIKVNIAAFDPVFQNSQFTLTRTFTDSASIPSSPDHGLTSQLRPVACSVLTTFSGSSLINGGMISGALLTGGASHTYFFDSNNPAGNCRNWENLAFIKGAYNGPLVDGVYVWWSPESNDDYQMKRPDEATSTDYPTILVSGQFIPGTPTNITSCARLEITTVYEVMTESLLLESQYQPGSQEVMDQTMSLLAGQQHAMPNKTHVDWINNVLDRIGSTGKFLVKNVAPILKLGEGVMGML